MSYTFVKIFFFIIVGFYIYLRLNYMKPTFCTHILICLTSITLSFFISNVATRLSTIYFPFMLLCFLIVLSFLWHKQLHFSPICAIVSIGMAYIIYSLLIIPITFVFYLFLNNGIANHITLIAFCAGILSSIIILFALKNKRILKAVHLLCGYKNFYTFSIVCFCIILIVTVAQAKIQDKGNNNTFAIGLVAIILILLQIIHHELQKYYLTKLKKLELESLRQELAEKDAMIQKLKDSNDHLAHLVHQDNKLIPAMESAVQHYLTDAASTPETQLVKGQALAQELQKLAEDRQGNLTSYHSLRDLPHTGHAGVDAMLSHMQERALAQNIEYKLQIAADFSTAIGNQISEADLVHLLSDLIENAIIATKTCDHREIFISLGMPNGVPSIEVRDSGTPFSPSVYQDFGIEKHSTHLDDGGSGIGLMDIWSLKRNYAASLHIHEYAPETAPFTKRITLLFDRKNHYLIRTFRPQEILKCRARTDMYVLPLE